MVTLAAVLLLGIGQNHPFEQGNKRTAFLAAGIFLALNGYRFEVDDSDLLGELIVEAIEREGTRPTSSAYCAPSSCRNSLP